MEQQQSNSVTDLLTWQIEEKPRRQLKKDKPVDKSEMFTIDESPDL